MLNKMDKFDIFVPHPLVITSLLPLECGCKPLVCLLKRPVLLSFLTSNTVQSDITHPARWWGCRIKNEQSSKQISFKIKNKKAFD